MKSVQDFDSYQERMRGVADKYTSQIAKLRKDGSTLQDIFSKLQSKINPQVLRPQSALDRIPKVDRQAEANEG